MVVETVEVAMEEAMVVVTAAVEKAEVPEAVTAAEERAEVQEAVMAAVERAVAMAAAGWVAARARAHALEPREPRVLKCSAAASFWRCCGASSRCYALSCCICCVC